MEGIYCEISLGYVNRSEITISLSYSNNSHVNVKIMILV